MASEYRCTWVPLEGVLEPAAAYISIKLAALEALRGGFTTAVDKHRKQWR